MKYISTVEVINAAEFDPKPLGFWAGFPLLASAVAPMLAVTLDPKGIDFGLSLHRSLLHELVDGVDLTKYATFFTSPDLLELSLNTLPYVSVALAKS
jgi:hypothetical protein